MVGLNDPWKVLGIAPGSSPEAIRQAYLKLVRLHHPDQFRTDPVRYQAQENMMREINMAYLQLKDRPATAPSGHAEPPPRRPREARTDRVPVRCAAHGRWAVIYCTECQAPLCTRCDTALTGLCPQHRRSRVDGL